jgi:uncharacterized protein (TIRG00374 family)
MLKAKLHRNKLKIWLGILISIITLGLACYNVKWEYLVKAIRESDVVFILLGMACLYINLILRAWRWQVLLSPIGRFGLFKACFPYYMIGYMSNLILPLRAGEIIRPFFFGKKEGVSKVSVFASVFVERLIDMIFLTCLLLFIMIIGVMEVPANVTHGVFSAGGIAVIVLLCFYVISKHSLYLLKFKWINRIQQMISNKFSGLLRSVADGFDILHRASKLVIVTFATLFIWLFGILTILSYLLSFKINVPWYAPIFVIVVTNLGMMIPSSPGFIGVAHFLYVVSLSLFGIDKNTALGFAIVIHGLSFIFIVVIGLISLWSEGLTFSNLAGSEFKNSLSSLNEK